MAQAQISDEHKLHQTMGLAALGKGAYNEARTSFLKAIQLQPEDAVSHASLAYTLFLENQFEAAVVLYGKALQIDPTLAIAHHGISAAYERLGDLPAAAHHRELGLSHRPVTVLRYDGIEDASDVLLLGTPGDANVDTSRFFHPALHRISALSVDHFPVDGQIPKHALIVNGIGEADITEDVLRKASRLIRNSSARVLNHPDRVLATGREHTAQLLAGIAGLRLPKVIRLSAHALQARMLANTLADCKLEYPLLLRVPGLHSGRKLELVNNADEVRTMLRTHPARDYFAIEYIDTRCEDRYYRKYRVVFIDGAMYPIHCACTTGWKAHYYTSNNANVMMLQQEEQRYLENFRDVLGESVVLSLAAVQERLGLEYGGIDFSLDTQNNIVVFETNATMSFPQPDRETQHSYRFTAFRKAQDAIIKMIANALKKNS
jgi:glutathione synthase/RimK-type ligase-like ATP-grasp enzyme